MEGGGTGRPNRFLRIVGWVEDAILITLLSIMIGLAIAQVLLRNLFESGITWGDPLLRVLVLWLGLTGALVATRLDKHISIDVLYRYLGPRAKSFSRVLADFFAACVSGIVAYHAARFVAIEYQAGTFAFASVPAWLVESIVPVAFGVIAIRYLGQTAQHVCEAFRGLRQS